MTSRSYPSQHTKYPNHGREMSNREARRTTRTLTDDEQTRVQDAREQVSTELPDMIARDQMRQEAGEEMTVSGELRRAIHASDHTLSTIAQKAGISQIMLDDFLTGERTLRSDVMDRLADALGCQLSQTL